MRSKAGVGVGLVELRVSPRAAAPDKFEAVKRAILHRPEERLRIVADVLTDPRTQELDALVFPGWTIVADRIPRALIDACGDRVVVLECLAPSARTKRVGAGAYDWTTHVVWRGGIVASARQRLSSASEVGDEETESLTSELTGRRATRVFSHPKLGETGLLVCGEVNVVRAAAPRAFAGFDTILNPAHTPSRLEAMRQKREVLSSRGALFSTANTHDAWKACDGKSWSPGHVAAEWFAHGRRQPRPDPEQLSPRASLRVARQGSTPASPGGR